MDLAKPGECRCGADKRPEWYIDRKGQYMMAVCEKWRWWNFWKHDRTGPHAYYAKPSPPN